ncbi:phosphoribosyltransferase [Kitasatospora acidiphila]|uniref:Phosphoribosyltransferase n=1 Tax=Kitasatospora acidiphila TaxID=2567942 RepID=A0A540VYU6_9ACTN|nr:phosphoribosyltransferase family protein [Kitasatospora acidiphila]TQF01939.1 phosphoribosyltransferase [Kitasatospora acidiphila]
MPETLAPTIPAPFAARTVERLSVPETSRRERVIHSLDGLEQPVRMADLTSAGQELWKKSNEEMELGPIDYLLGLDAGGIIPTLALAQAAGLPYKIAWKLHLPLEGMVQFSEPHARRTDVYAYGITRGSRVLIVDDEITTGETLANLTQRLRGAGAIPLGAVCLVEDKRHAGRHRLAGLGLPLTSLHSIQADR